MRIRVIGGKDSFARLLRISRRCFGLISLRLRRCRSSSGAYGSIRRSISWPAISSAFAALLARARARWALGACSVAMIDLHSAQTMSAASCSFLSLALSTSKISGWTLLQVGHHTRGKWSSLMIGLHEGVCWDNAGQRIPVPGDRHRGAGLHRLRGT
jgi:hypothetical protein